MINAVVDCLMNHRSIRRFQPRPLEPDVLDTILHAGIRGATSSNLQHYSLIVVDDMAKKRALSSDPMVEIATAIIAVVDQYRLKRWLELNGAPFQFDQAMNLFVGFWDAIIALQNVVVAAESLGLGTVYIGSILGKDLASILGTPEYVSPAGMVLVGYPDEWPALRPRLPLAAVVHRNGYQIPSDDDIRAFYHERDREWGTRPKEQRRDLEEQGIHNLAQEVSRHYSPEFVARESRAILANLSQARFKLAVGPSLEV